MAEYNNSISITLGRKLVSQQPIDDRHFYRSLSDVGIDLAAPINAYYAWYEFMPVYIAELNAWAAWMNVNALPAGVDPNTRISGLSATYPANWPTPPNLPSGVYAGQTFSLFQVEAYIGKHSHGVLDITDITNYFYDKSQVDSLLDDKEDSLPTNGTGALAYLVNVSGTLSWVIPPTTISDVTAPGLWVKESGAWVLDYDVLSSGLQAQTPTNKLLRPAHFVLAPGTYPMNDPATMPTGYNMVVTHDGTGSFSVDLTGWPLDGVNTTHAIPQFQSMWIGIANGAWRRLDKVT